MLARGVSLDCWPQDTSMLTKDVSVLGWPSDALSLRLAYFFSDPFLLDLA